MNAAGLKEKSDLARRRKQRRAGIQWFAIALLICLALFGTFIYLLNQETGDDDSVLNGLGVNVVSLVQVVSGP